MENTTLDKFEKYFSLLGRWMKAYHIWYVQGVEIGQYVLFSFASALTPVKGLYHYVTYHHHYKAELRIPKIQIILHLSKYSAF